jgi:hypothetical protein
MYLVEEHAGVRYETPRPDRPRLPKGIGKSMNDARTLTGSDDKAQKIKGGTWGFAN